MVLPNVPKLGMSVSFAMTSAIPAEYNSYFSSLEEAQACCNCWSSWLDRHTVLLQPNHSRSDRFFSRRVYHPT